MVFSSSARVAAGLFAAAAATLLATPSAYATTYYVSPSGSNTNPGTSTAAPLQTLTYAANSKALVSGDVIRLAAGQYNETVQSKPKPGVHIAGAGQSLTVITWNKVQSSTARRIYPDLYCIYYENGGTGAAVHDLTITGAKLGSDGKPTAPTATAYEERASGGILVRNADSFRIYNVTANSFRRSGLFLSESVNSSIDHCTADDTIVLMGDLTSCSIHDNTITDRKGQYALSGTRVAWDTLASPGAGGSNRNKFTHVDIYNNTVTTTSRAANSNGNTGPNFSMEMYNNKSDDVQIHNNTFNAALSLPEGGRDTGEVIPAHTIRVHDNNMKLISGYMFAVEATTNNLEIDHNYIANGWYPIYISGVHPQNLYIHNNILDSPESQSVINIKGGVTNFRFTYNTVYMKASMPLCNLDGSTSTGLTFTNNIFYKEGTPFTGAFINPTNGAVANAVSVYANDFFNWPTYSAGVPSGARAYVTVDPAFQKTGARDAFVASNTWFTPTNSAAVGFGFSYGP